MLIVSDDPRAEEFWKDLNKTGLVNSRPGDDGVIIQVQAIATYPESWNWQVRPR